MLRYKIKYVSIWLLSNRKHDINHIMHNECTENFEKWKQ